MKQITISVIVPIYNVELYLQEAIDSILGQTILIHEIILVDDGSTDSSGEICDEYATKFHQIKVIHQENQGLGAARNAGLDQATGKYVAFMDSDDYVHSTMYEVLLQKCMEYDAVISCCGRIRVKKDKDSIKISNDENSIIQEEISMTKEEAITRLLLQKGMTYSACDKLFLKSVFDQIRFPADKTISEDLPCIFNVIKNAKRIVHTGKNLYYYRLVENSITQSKFSIGKKSHLGYTKEIQSIIIKEIPQLNQQALYAVLQATMHLYVSIMKSENNKDMDIVTLKKELKADIRKESYRIVKNNYLNKNAKLSALLIGYHMYWVLRVLKK